MRTAPTKALSAGNTYVFIVRSIWNSKCLIFSLRSIWISAGICLLGIIGFLIATTIVLALIPIYISKKNLTPSENSDNYKHLTLGFLIEFYWCSLFPLDSKFFIEYSADANADTSTTGTVENLDEVILHRQRSSNLSRMWWIFLLGFEKSGNQWSGGLNYWCGSSNIRTTKTA